jgi:hypothetical protein
MCNLRVIPHPTNEKFWVSTCFKDSKWVEDEINMLTEYSYLDIEVWLVSVIM